MRFTALSALAAVSTSILALPITPSGNSIILGDNTINRRNPEDDKTNTAELLFTPVVSRWSPSQAKTQGIRGWHDSKSGQQWPSLVLRRQKALQPLAQEYLRRRPLTLQHSCCRPELQKGLKLPGLKFADDDGNSVVITVVEAGGPEEYEELQGCR
ncbi:hypothetical protein Vi05172_g13460 [Venturia inaequalis]|nr:hypothetical protein Vi05172_g13460 [Venturia inaequalis]